jgi:hypothetical protein
LWHVFHYLKNIKIKQIFSAVMDVQLFLCTDIRRADCMSDNAEQQLMQVLEICEFFSIQLEESIDICDVS